MDRKKTKANREPITKKTRFSVFKRDGFICQYCGKTPPATTLEVDHINPVSKGGDNSIDNLVTACFDCNRGKGADLLTVAPQTVTQKAEILAEREEQIKAFNKLLKSKRKREDLEIEAIEAIFSEVHKGSRFSDIFKSSIRQNFLPYLDIETLKNAISKACSSGRDAENAIKYFCGICWCIRRER